MAAAIYATKHLNHLKFTAILAITEDPMNSPEKFKKSMDIIEVLSGHRDHHSNRIPESIQEHLRNFCDKDPSDDDHFLEKLKKI